jgi:hypothetical protein
MNVSVHLKMDVASFYGQSTLVTGSETAETILKCVDTYNVNTYTVNLFIFISRNAVYTSVHLNIFYKYTILTHTYSIWSCG